MQTTITTRTNGYAASGSDATDDHAVIAGLVQLIVDGKHDRARATCETIKREWFSDPDAAAVYKACTKALKGPSPTGHDIRLALGNKPAAGELALLVDVLGRCGGANDGYALGVDRYIATIEASHYARSVKDAASAILSRTTAGIGDAADLDRLQSDIARCRDAMERKDPDTSRQLRITPLSAIDAKPPCWLWPQRIVGNGLTILTGPVGASKSLFAIDIATKVSTGARWPDGSGSAPTGEVILFGAEDDASSAIRPRAEAAGADLDKVFVCDGMDAEGGEPGDTEQLVLERHVKYLRQLLAQRPDCRLLIFDPLPDFIAADSNVSGDVRSALTPLVKVAQDFNVAVLAILHQNKKTDLTSVNRIAGSGAFSQLSRQILALADHPEDKAGEIDSRRVLLVAKTNYGERGVGQCYKLTARMHGQVGLEWLHGTVRMDADALYKKPTGGSAHDEARSDAADALRELIGDGEWHPRTAIAEALELKEITGRPLERATKDLKIEKKQLTVDGQRCWMWRLPKVLSDRGDSSQPDPAFDAFAYPDEWR